MDIGWEKPTTFFLVLDLAVMLSGVFLGIVLGHDRTGVLILGLGGLGLIAAFILGRLNGAW